VRVKELETRQKTNVGGPSTNNDTIRSLGAVVAAVSMAHHFSVWPVQKDIGSFRNRSTPPGVDREARVSNSVKVFRCCLLLVASPVE
jgi:hypothetical protein